MQCNHSAINIAGMAHHRASALARLLLSVVLCCASCLAQRTTPAPRNGNADWKRCNAKLTSELRAADRRRQGPQLLYYGDSIIEALRGTDHCLPCKISTRTACADVPPVLRQRHRPLVLGIAGDQVANLIWRLQNGHMPSKHKPKVAVLLIGTNDLGAAGAGRRGRAAARALAAAVPGVASRVQQAVRVMQQGMPDTHVVLLGLLPRGSGSGEGRLVPDNDHRWPSDYSAALGSINTRLRKVVGRDGTGRLHFLDCSAAFLKAGRQRRIDAALMPDALHPSADGYRALGRCMDSLLTRLLR